MFNECLIHLFDHTCLNMICVCAQLYMDQSKKIFDHFICIWKWFLSLFVFMFSVYIVFHYLNMFCVEKHFSRLSSRLASHETPVASSSRSFPDSSRDSLVTRPVAKCPETAFLRAFSGKLVLNLSNPLLNISFNIFTSKPNQIEWFFHFLTSLR